MKGTAKLQTFRGRKVSTDSSIEGKVLASMRWCLWSKGSLFCSFPGIRRCSYLAQEIVQPSTPRHYSLSWYVGEPEKTLLARRQARSYAVCDLSTGAEDWPVVVNAVLDFSQNGDGFGDVVHATEFMQVRPMWGPIVLIARGTHVRNCGPSGKDAGNKCAR
jgi:hypothetical protein